ncbi:MAG: sulfatase [Bacteroidales bacterium]|nr:sulfatase [Bacteroidales bacterium]
MKLLKIVLLLSAVVFLQTTCVTEKEDKSPNVLIITVDDMKDWTGFLGGYEGTVHTPNMDRLATRGISFTNAHTSATVCCPSRYAFFLGKRPSSTGLYNNNQWWKPNYPLMISLPQYFRQHGYYAAGAGKVFHHTPGNNPPCSWDEYQDQVFDDPWNFAEWSVERYAIRYGYRKPIIPYPDWKPLNGIYPIKSELDWGPIPGKKEKDYGDVQAIKFAQNFLNRKQQKPFFLAIGIFRPHLPWHVPKKYFDQYPLDQIVLPGGFKEDDLDDVPETGKKLALAGYKDFHQIREEGKWKEAIQAYLASISFADAQVGSVLNALEKSKYADNTIVLLWSDHGWHLGSKQHWHKQTLWEEATRIPFIIRVPDVTKNGSICKHPVDMVNVFPTLISLCGLLPMEGLDGHDMTSILKNPESNWKWPALSEIKTGNMAVRTNKWRYIRYKDGEEELYDRENDPYEWNNLTGNSKYRSILEEHRKWIPDTFATPVPGKEAFFFDPHEYTWMNKETKQFVDGKK